MRRHKQKETLVAEVNDKGEVDKTKDKHRSHLSDCLRYLLSTFHGKLINIVFSDADGE